MYNIYFALYLAHLDDTHFSQLRILNAKRSQKDFQKIIRSHNISHSHLRDTLPFRITTVYLVLTNITRFYSTPYTYTALFFRSFFFFFLKGSQFDVRYFQCGLGEHACASQNELSNFLFTILSTCQSILRRLSSTTPFRSSATRSAFHHTPSQLND